MMTWKGGDSDPSRDDAATRGKGKGWGMTRGGESGREVTVGLRRRKRKVVRGD